MIPLFKPYFFIFQVRRHNHIRKKFKLETKDSQRQVERQNFLLQKCKYIICIGSTRTSAAGPLELGKGGKVNSVQEACVKCFAAHILKFEILQMMWKNETNNAKMIDLLVKNWKLRVWCSLFHVFLWFARFQILIHEPQCIWGKLFALDWL